MGPIVIDDPQAVSLAEQLAADTGEPLSEAVIVALRERLERVHEERRLPSALVDRLTAIAQRCGARPVLDDRSADEILGYDDDGLPT